jgi:hypothetical protein
VREGGLLVWVLGGVDVSLVGAGEQRGIRVTRILVGPGGHALGELAGLNVHVHETLPLEEAARAHELLQAGGLRGKLVLTLK